MSYAERRALETSDPREVVPNVRPDRGDPGSAVVDPALAGLVGFALGEPDLTVEGVRYWTAESVAKLVTRLPSRAPSGSAGG